MSDRFVKHGTFVIEKNYPAGRGRVYEALADAEAKARWFSKPEIFEFRVGGREYSSGELPDGAVMVFDAMYQEIVPRERVVYTYSMDMNGVRISVSITTIELLDVEGGTKLVFTEQGAFFDGHDTVEIREHGTREMLGMLGRVLESDEELVPGEQEVVNARFYDAPRELVFQAWQKPEQLAAWWGPSGFTNTFHEFDFRDGGSWRFTMHGPDGTDYANENTFLEIVPNERIVLEHRQKPTFRITATFKEAGGRTRLIFRQRFEHAEELTQVLSYCPECNEQNLDKLGAVLAGNPSATLA